MRWIAVGRAPICFTIPTAAASTPAMPDAYRKLLTDHRIRCSMSRRGNCWDNAAMERCMGTYKHEWVKGTIYEGLNDVRTGLFAFAEIYYNRQRIHQAIGYVTPVEHEAAYHQKHAA